MFEKRKRCRERRSESFQPEVQRNGGPFRNVPERPRFDRERPRKSGPILPEGLGQFIADVGPDILERMARLLKPYSIAQPFSGWDPVPIGRPPSEVNTTRDPQIPFAVNIPRLSEAEIKEIFETALAALPQSHAPIPGIDLGRDAGQSSPSTSPTDPIRQSILPPDSELAELLRHPCIIVIVGHRGSGKTALAFRIVELMRYRASPYVLGLPANAAKLLPEWIGLIDDLESIATNSVIYIPESYRLFHARAAQTRQNRLLADLVNLSRQRRQTLIFDIQNPAHLDRNILSETDILLIKEPGPFTSGFDRPQWRRFMDGARSTFAILDKRSRRRSVWVFAPHSGIEGRILQNELPSFWSERLSRVFGSPSVSSKNDAFLGAPLNHPESISSGSAHTRLAKGPSREECKALATRLHEMGLSYGAIARKMGIGKTQAWRLVKEE